MLSVQNFIFSLFTSFSHANCHHQIFSVTERTCTKRGFQSKQTYFCYSSLLSKTKHGEVLLWPEIKSENFGKINLNAVNVFSIILNT